MEGGCALAQKNMPKLPQQQQTSTLEVLDKKSYNTGELTVPKIPKNRIVLNNHLKLVLALLVLIAVLIGVYFAFGRFAGKSSDTNEENVSANGQFEFPAEPTNIVFPSEEVKEKFLSNFRLAEEEKDINKRFFILEENYVILKGMYSASLSYDHRVILEKYRESMKKNFSQQYQKSTVWEFACVDALCDKATSYSTEIESIRKAITDNTAMDQAVKDGILRSIDLAVKTEDKAAQGQVYVAVLSSLFSEHERTKDESIKVIYSSLLAYLEKNYPDQHIPTQIKI